MYYNHLVKAPIGTPGVSIRHVNDTAYVYYIIGYEYKEGRIDFNDPEISKWRTVSIDTTIGKICKDHPDMMYPNKRFYHYFPSLSYPREIGLYHSNCLQVGTFLIIKKIANEYHLEDILKDTIGDATDSLLDAASYRIVSQNIERLRQYVMTSNLQFRGFTCIL